MVNIMIDKRIEPLNVQISQDLFSKIYGFFEYLDLTDLSFPRFFNVNDI
jgi:hypothetical protein